MALQKQVIAYTFEQGLDEKTDPKLTQNLTTLENAIFEKRFTLQKRYGWIPTSRDVLGGGTITTGAALGLFNNELLLFTDQLVYSYASANDAWVDKGSAVSVAVGARDIVRNNYSQTNPDNAITGNLEIIAWEDARGGVRASVYDTASELALVSDLEIDGASTVSHCKTIACGQFLFVYYCNGANLVVQRINSTDPSQFSAAQVLRTDLDSTLCFDVAVISSSMIVSYRNNAGSITVMYVTQAMVVGSPLVGLPNPVLLTGDAEVISIAAHTAALNTYIVICHQSTVDGVVTTTLFTDLTVFHTNIIDASATNVCLNIAQIAWLVNSDVIIRIYWSQNPTLTTDFRIYETNYEVVSNTQLGSTQLFLIGLALNAKPYLHDGRIFVPVAFESVEQSTYFIVRDDGFVTAKIASNNGGGIPTNNLLSEVNKLDTFIYSFPILVKGRLQSESAILYTNTGVSDVVVDHNDQDIFSSTQSGQNTMIAGGYLKMYDGDSVVEQGFHFYPEGITIATSTTGGSMSDGTYLYRVMWEWIDAKGQIHRSAPSAPISVTLSGGTSTQAVTLDIPTLKLTQKRSVNASGSPVSNPRVDPVAVVYRTEDTGVIYYRTTSPLTPTFNNPTQDSIAVVDVLDDLSILSNEILYTSGGVLENIAAPACTILQLYKNRLFLAGLENPNQIWYSNEQIIGEGLNFNDLLSISVDATGGPITVLSVLDDKLVIFKQFAIFILAGDGPNLTGAQNDYSKPQLVNSDVGCIDSNSAVITPAGVMFKSTKGIYLIDRSLQLSYIGSPVENYNSASVIRSTLVQNRNEVRFLLATGQVLVYNYYFQQWSVFTNFDNGTDALIYGSEYTYLTLNGQVRQETTEQYFDNTSPIQMKVVTPWFSFAGFQGYQRIYRVFLIGKFYSQHILRVRVGYDFKGSWAETILIDTSTLIGTSTFGSESPFGTESTWAGELDVYQLQFDVGIQKCQAIRFEISDNSSIAGSGQGWELTGLTFEVGAKRGGNKISVAQKFAGS